MHTSTHAITETDQCTQSHMRSPRQINSHRSTHVYKHTHAATCTSLRKGGEGAPPPPPPGANISPPYIGTAHSRIGPLQTEPLKFQTFTLGRQAVQADQGFRPKPQQHPYHTGFSHQTLRLRGRPTRVWKLTPWPYTPTRVWQLAPWPCTLAPPHCKKNEGTGFLPPSLREE